MSGMSNMSDRSGLRDMRDKREMSGTLSRSHILTFSRSHILTFSHSHVLTLSRSHVLTFSRSLVAPPGGYNSGSRSNIKAFGTKTAVTGDSYQFVYAVQEIFRNS